VRRRLLRLIVRVPVLGRLYLRGLARAIERAPRSKLPPELQQLRGMLDRLSPQERVKLLEAAIKGQVPHPEQLSREMRRAARRQSRRRP
jgi:hypothetical protein